MDFKNVTDATKNVVKTKNSVPKSSTLSNSTNELSKTNNTSDLAKGQAQRNLNGIQNAQSDGTELTGKDVEAIANKAVKDVGGVALEAAAGVPKQATDKVVDKVANSKVLSTGNSILHPIRNARQQKNFQRIADKINKNPKLKNSAKKAANYSKKDTVNKRLVKEETKAKQKALEQQNSDNADTDNNLINPDLTSSLKKVVNFIKKHPDIAGTIAMIIFGALIMGLVILMLSSAIMYGIKVLSDIKQGINDAGEIILNGLTLHGWTTNRGVYEENIVSTSNKYIGDKDMYLEENVDETKIRYYVNAATFYSNVIDPDLISDTVDHTDETVSDSESSTETEFTNMFVANGGDINSKFATVKDDPKDLINNMFVCSVLIKNDSGETGWTQSNDKGLCEGSLEKAQQSDSKILDIKWFLSDDAYKDYLQTSYVRNRYINCGDCGYENSTETEKEEAINKISNEILSQAKTFYTNNNASDESNYTAYNINSSGITVKDEDGNVVGTFSMQEYVSKVVERDASSYNNEIKKAYALTVISKLLINGTSTEIIETGLSDIIVDTSTTSAVKDVIDLKLMKDGKVFFSGFDFTKVVGMNNLDYNSIISELFGADVTIEKSISNGLQLDTTTGFYMRVSPAAVDDPYYYGASHVGLIGECAWYATNRAIEITRSLGVYTWWGNVNGGNFCTSSNTAASKYKTCWPSRGEDCTPKQGSIISWTYGDYGHVGIIEKVDPDGTIYLSHAAVSKGGYAIKYGYKLETMWEKFSSGEVTRKSNCTDYGNTGCLQYQKFSNKNALEHIYSGYTTSCYIYLQEPLK